MWTTSLVTGYGPLRRASKSYPHLITLMESPIWFRQDETKEVLTQNVYPMGSLDYQLTRKNSPTPVSVSQLGGSKTITTSDAVLDRSSVDRIESQ